MAYTLTDTITLNARGEVFRDGKGFYVAISRATSTSSTSDTASSTPRSPARTPPTARSPSAPPGNPTLPKPISGLLIRPELRYDSTLAGPNAFNNGKDRGSFTIATDFVLTF